MKARVTWRALLVTLAIILMVSAGVISFFVVRDYDESLEIVQQQMTNKDEQIQTLWQDSALLQQRADTMVLISVLAPEQAAAWDVIKQHYLPQAEQSHLFDVKAILQQLSVEKELLLASINAHYTDKLMLQEHVNALNQTRGMYQTIAFFLQILGLIAVIISRDGT